MTWEELLEKAQKLGYVLVMFDDGQGLTLRKQDNTCGIYFYYDMTDKEKGGEIGARIDHWSMNWFRKIAHQTRCIKSC